MIYHTHSLLPNEIARLSHSHNHICKFHICALVGSVELLIKVEVLAVVKQRPQNRVREAVIIGLWQARSQ